MKVAIFENPRLKNLKGRKNLGLDLYKSVDI